MSKPLDLKMLLQAYAIGVFPMADSRDAPDIYWVEPKTRGILPLDGFHLSRSLAKVLRSERFSHTADHAFEAVVEACGAAVENRPTTWINKQIIEAVTQLHALGTAHSIEVWQDGNLVGGLYGIALGRAFFGESMFSRATDGSKAALAHLVARLRCGGFELLDCQFITPHLASLGAVEISREDYLTRLDKALADDRPGGDFYHFSSSYESADRSSSRVMMVSSPISGCSILQDLTQTS